MYCRCVLRSLALSALALSSVLASAGCKKGIEYHRVEFPGFALDVPQGMDYRNDPATEYRAGEARWKDGSRLVIVSWQVGGRAPPEKMPDLVRGMPIGSPNAPELETEPATAVIVNGNQATRTDGRTESMSLSVVDIDCGKRSIMVVMGALRDLDALRERVLGSFECRPIADQEQPIGASAAPFGVDDPALLTGWKRSENDALFMMSNGPTILMALQVPRSDEAAPLLLDKATAELMTMTGAEWTSGQTETRQTKWGERTFRRGRVKIDQQVVAGVVTFWSCEGRSDAVLAMAFVPTDGDLGTAIDFISGLRCANPGDPPI